MLDSTTTSLATSVTCFLLVVVLSRAHAWDVFNKFRSRRSPWYRRAPNIETETEPDTGIETDDRYQDEDGTASTESQAAYSDSIQRLILILGSVVALVVSLMAAVLTTTGSLTKGRPLLIREQWLHFAVWILITFQTWTMFTTLSSPRRYSLGARTSFACLLTAVAIPVENFSLQSSQSESYPEPLNRHLTVSTVQFGAAIILAVTAVLIPRRPDVFLDGKIVDRQYTTSLLSRFTFSWPASILAYAAKNNGLKIDDLPAVGNDIRTKTLRQRWNAVPKQDRLWRTVIRSHAPAFAAQQSLQVISAVTNFLPQIALYQLLRELEARDEGDCSQTRLWLVVLVFGLAVAFSSWLESQLFFTTFMKVGVPVLEQLTAVLFNKAIRRKDVKDIASEKVEEKGNGEPAVDQSSAGQKTEDGVTKESDPGADDVSHSKQSTVNLIGSDVGRVADFAMWNHLLTGSVIQLVVAVFFLVKLMGVIPVLCGFSIPVLIAPINYFIFRRYSAAQRELMRHRDKKMTIMTEALQGIRQIKFNALEREWYNKILEHRGKELATQWRVFQFETVVVSIYIFGPTCLSALALTVYAVINKGLSSSVAFTTIAVFESIEMNLGIIPEMFTDLFDAIVSSKRLQDFLDSAEVGRNTSPGDQITFSDATVSWPSDKPDQDDESFKLRDLHLRFPDGALTVISGKTGSGKTLMLSAIIGESEILSGEVVVPRAVPAAERFDHKAHPGNWIVKRSIAYVSQTPWIENATVRDNILFGLPFEEARFHDVVRVCALEKDLEMLEDGELTDIGANGVNLSGGQKWRVSFARALYSRAGILILDDVFSAVDAHVGRHLFEEALTGDLGAGRTRVLATHHVALCLPKTDYSVHLENGRVAFAGDTKELRQDGRLKDILADGTTEQRDEEEMADNENALLVDDGGHLMKVDTHRSTRSRTVSTVGDVSPSLPRRRSNAGEPELTKQPEAPKKFVQEETRETGTVKLEIYKTYIKAAGGFRYWALIAFVFVILVVIDLGRPYWISIWARRSDTAAVRPPALAQPPSGWVQQSRQRSQDAADGRGVIFYVGIYVAVSLAAWLVGTLRAFSIFVASIKASKVLFERMTFAILRTPLRFLDTTPVGRIANRFTADFNGIDGAISWDLSQLMQCVISMLSIVIAGLLVSPAVIVLTVALLAAAWYYASIYLASAREVKRLESNAKSPIFELFGSALTGIATVRAFDKGDTYVERMDGRINSHAQAYWNMWLFNRWMGFRLEMVSAVFTAAIAALIAGLPTIDAPLAGFALSFTLQIGGSVMWMVRQYSNVELQFNAVERIVEYSNLAIEPQTGDDAPAAWPTKGELDVTDLVVAYAEDLPPVLRGLSFSVQQNERVGVVGRTGAGKSSLTLALFRFLEAKSGSIHVDGIDISKIKLHDLRSRLAIIPQDPVLFSGTVRSNLDPFDQYSDTELRDALARVHLISPASAFPSTQPSGTATPVLSDARDDSTATPASPTADTEPAEPTAAVDPSPPTPGARENANVFKSLSSSISQGGLNLSQGQRQLLCLARAIVSRPKVMVLDEATSSVDLDTDALIQRSIREEFRNSTLIVIAHRLSTIADFDRILVMGEGRVLEYDSPTTLMQKEAGGDEATFRRMVEQSGEKAVLEGIIHGRDR